MPHMRTGCSFSVGLHAKSVHPGGIKTNLMRHMPNTADMIPKEGPFYNMLKSPEQGAATTVWAAIGKEWEGKGGKYLEECDVSPPVDPNKSDYTPADAGHKPYAYDTEAASKLWDISNKLTGFTEGKLQRKSRL